MVGSGRRQRGAGRAAGIDRFAESQSLGPNAPAAANEPPRTGARTDSPARQSAGGKPPEAAEIAARALAEGANDLEALRSAMADFDGCGLKRTATQLVFADGVPGSKVMFCGEAPGGESDQIAAGSSAEPGNCWTACLPPSASIGAASISPMSSRGGHQANGPRAAGTQACLPFIRRQIDLADPEILVCLGGSAVQTLLGVQGGIARIRLVVQLPARRQPADQGAGDVPSGLPASAAGAEAAGVGGHAGAGKGARQPADVTSRICI